MVLFKQVPILPNKKKKSNKKINTIMKVISVSNSTML